MSPADYVYVKPDELLPHPLNARVYGKENLDPNFVDSIRVNGVHEPVVVVQSKINGVLGLYILSGHRRVKAAERVGRTVPIRIVEDAGSLWQESYLLESNRQREKTPEQKAREFTELKRIEAALAKERQQEHGKTAPGRTNTGGKFATSDKGKARDKAAVKVGMKPRTAEKLEKIVKVADAGDSVARTALDEINAGKKSIHAAANEITPIVKKKTKVQREAEEQEQFCKRRSIEELESKYCADLLATNLAEYIVEADAKVIEFGQDGKLMIRLRFRDDGPFYAFVEQMKKMPKYAAKKKAA